VKRQQRQQNVSCTAESYGCTEWLTSTPPVSYYIGAVEKSTIMFQHAAAGVEDLELSQAIYNTYGYRPAPVVRGVNGETTASPSPALLPVGDVIELGDLLRVAGVDLDNAAQSSMHAVNKTSDELPRYTGLTLRVTVVYDSVGYHYTVRANPIEAKVESYVVSHGVNGSALREYQDLHGINILFTTTGGPTYFDFQTLILTLVAGVALLASVKTLANVCLMYVLPRRADYRLFVQTVTPDFLPDSEHESRVLDDVLRAKRRKRSLLVSTRTETLNEERMTDPLVAAQAVPVADGAVQDV